MNYHITYKTNPDDHAKSRDIFFQAKPSNEEAQRILGTLWSVPAAEIIILSITEQDVNHLSPEFLSQKHV